MSKWIDSRTRSRAIAAVIAGVAPLLGREIPEKPYIGAGQLLLERAALSAFFLEDLLAPIEGIE